MRDIDAGERSELGGDGSCHMSHVYTCPVTQGLDPDLDLVGVGNPGPGSRSGSGAGSDFWT